MGSRPPWEVFYACPSATAPAFLEAAAALAPSAAAADGLAAEAAAAEAVPRPAAERLVALAVLARATQVGGLAVGLRRRLWQFCKPLCVPEVS